MAGLVNPGVTTSDSLRGSDKRRCQACNTKVTLLFKRADGKLACVECTPKSDQFVELVDAGQA